MAAKARGGRGGKAGGPRSPGGTGTRTRTPARAPARGRAAGRRADEADGAPAGPARRRAAGRGAPAEVLVAAWDDDSRDGAIMQVPVPAEPAGAFAFRIVAARAPAAGLYSQGTAEFRHWNAAVALSRAAAFWRGCLPGNADWHGTRVLDVFLDKGAFLNAYYQRHEGLSFFHDAVGGEAIFTGESPDTLTHEFGHAVLDGLRPELFDTKATEPAAFHEAFGDISAMLTALQIPTFRQAVFADTGGRLARSSRLSRVMEHLGWAVRRRVPGGADPDCLRNAANSFFYRDPMTLPSDAPANMLSSEEHSFSRVFSGAFLEALSGMLLAHGAGADEAVLQEVSVAAGQMIGWAARTAPIVPQYFSQVAAGMLEADARLHQGRYRAALASAFVRRGILSLDTAAGVASQQASAAFAAAAAATGGPDAQAGGATAADVQLPELALGGADFGLGPLELLVQAPAELAPSAAAAAAAAGAPRPAGAAARFAAAPAAPDVGSVPSPDANRVARSFLEDLFRRGRVDVVAAGEDVAVLHPFVRKTHVLERHGRGGTAFAVTRRCFACGLDPL